MDQSIIPLIYGTVSVVCFFCLLPVYKALQARYTHWEDPENDPRWNVSSKSRTNISLKIKELDIGFHKQRLSKRSFQNNLCK